MSKPRRISLVLILVLGIAVAGSSSVLGGSILPPLELRTADGGSITEHDLIGSTVLLFIQPYCFTCQEAIIIADSLQAANPDLSFFAVSPVDTPALIGMMSNSSLPVIFDEQMLLSSLFKVSRAPTFVFISGRSEVASFPWPFDLEHLEEETSLLQATSIPWPTGFEALLDGIAPDFSADSLTGNKVEFSTLARPILVAFLSISCSHCYTLMPELLDLTDLYSVCILFVGEMEDPDSFIGIGGDGLIILRDPDWDIADDYSVDETPALVLVMSEDRIAWTHLGAVQGLKVVMQAAVQEHSQP